MSVWVAAGVTAWAAAGEGWREAEGVWVWVKEGVGVLEEEGKGEVMVVVPERGWVAAWEEKGEVPPACHTPRQTTLGLR